MIKLFRVKYYNFQTCLVTNYVQFSCLQYCTIIYYLENSSLYKVRDPFFVSILIIENETIWDEISLIIFSIFHNVSSFQNNIIYCTFNLEKTYILKWHEPMAYIFVDYFIINQFGYLIISILIFNINFQFDFFEFWLCMV